MKKLIIFVTFLLLLVFTPKIHAGKMPIYFHDGENGIITEKPVDIDSLHVQYHISDKDAELRMHYTLENTNNEKIKVILPITNIFKNNPSINIYVDDLEIDYHKYYSENYFYYYNDSRLKLENYEDFMNILNTNPEFDDLEGVLYTFDLENVNNNELIIEKPKNKRLFYLYNDLILKTNNYDIRFDFNKLSDNDNAYLFILGADIDDNFITSHTTKELMKVSDYFNLTKDSYQNDHTDTLRQYAISTIKQYEYFIKKMTADTYIYDSNLLEYDILSYFYAYVFELDFTKTTSINILIHQDAYPNNVSNMKDTYSYALKLYQNTFSSINKYYFNIVTTNRYPYVFGDSVSQLTEYIYNLNINNTKDNTISFNITSNKNYVNLYNNYATHFILRLILPLILGILLIFTVLLTPIFLIYKSKKRI